LPQDQTLRYLKYSIVIFSLFIIYNTLIPFHFYTSFSKVMRDLDMVNLTPFMRKGKLNSLTDIAGNLLLFMPLGFLLYLYFIEKGSKTGLILRSVLRGFLLSLAIEISQLFFKYRITSVTDLINNSLGTFFGALAARIYLRSFAQKLKRLLHNILKNEPLTLFIFLIILVQLFSSLLPFNVSITVSDLKKSAAYSNITPFGMQPLGLLLGAHVKHLDKLRFSWVEFNGNVLFYLFYGYLVMYAYRAYWRGRKYAALKLFSLMILYFPAMEFIQFFIRSRFSDINDIISGLIGAALGALLFYAVKKESWFRRTDKLELRHFKFLIGLYYLYILYQGFQPFNFTTQSSVLALNLKIHNLAPFYAYFKVTSLWNIYDIVETFFLAAPLGIILSVHFGAEKSQRQVESYSLTAGLLIGAFIEIGQIFLPGRTGDITDALIMAAGALSGAVFYAYYEKNYLSGQNFLASLENAFDPEARFD